MNHCSHHVVVILFQKEKLRFSSIQHVVTKVDSQPTAENGVLVLVTGRLKVVFKQFGIIFVFEDYW